MVARGGKCEIGENFQMNNGIKGNPIGRAQPCILWVDKNAELIIGNNVGISQTALVCHHKITIGNHVKIGGNVCVYDTDFHSLSADLRKDPELDIKHKFKSIQFYRVSQASILTNLTRKDILKVENMNLM